MMCCVNQLADRKSATIDVGDAGATFGESVMYRS